MMDDTDPSGSAAVEPELMTHIKVELVEDEEGKCALANSPFFFLLSLPG